MTPSQLSKKVPPGFTFIGSLLLNWRLVSLPVILSGIFKPNIWQTILIFLVTLPISVATVVCLRNLRYTKRLKGLGAELPPLLPSKSVGGLDLLKDLRWEYRFGYLGDCYLRCERLCHGMNAKMLSRRDRDQLGSKNRVHNVRYDSLGAPCTCMHCTTYQAVR